MVQSARWLCSLVLLLLGGWMLLGVDAPSASAEGKDSGREHAWLTNKRLLETWRRDPEHYQRLLEDLRAFQAMPVERQLRLREFDQQLHQQKPEAQQRLWGVMERYTGWLKRLPAHQREYIESAIDDRQKLARIRELRQKEWLASLPGKTQKEILALPPEQQPAAMERVRKFEAKRRYDWIHDPVPVPKPPRKDKPVRLNELPTEVQIYVEKSLFPLLQPEDRRKIHEAEGHPWPTLVRTLHSLAERTPVPLPGPIGPVRVRDLKPEQVEILLAAPPRLQQKVRQAQEKWPDFGVALLELPRRGKGPILPVEVMPATPAAFPHPVQQFLTNELLPVLTSTERHTLEQAKNRWPEYPRQLMRLAHEHKLTVPGTALPGPADLWDKARTEPPTTRTAPKPLPSMAEVTPRRRP